MNADAVAARERAARENFMVTMLWEEVQLLGSEIVSDLVNLCAWQRALAERAGRCCGCDAFSAAQVYDVGVVWHSSRTSPLWKSSWKWKW